MTPLISVLIIPGAVSTAVNMVTAMVKRICNGIEKRLLKKGELRSPVILIPYIIHMIVTREAFIKKGQLIKTQLPF